MGRFVPQKNSKHKCKPIPNAPQNRSFRTSLSGHPPRRHSIPPAVDCFAGTPIAPATYAFRKLPSVH